MKTAEFDFELPAGLIAHRPLERRDGSRLMVLKGNEIVHGAFTDLPRRLSPGDLLVMNNTKVFPARLRGRKPSGNVLDMLMIRDKGEGRWEIASRGRYTGIVYLRGGIAVKVWEGTEAAFPSGVDPREVLWSQGLMPLPPYIRREPDDEDRERYQTVYAEVEGSIAAPTAGLHFTPALIEALSDRGIRVRTITLHVGTGTFKPVRADRVEDHRMDPEYFEVAASLIDEIAGAKARNCKVVAVGTTATRAIEACASGLFVGDAGNGLIRGHTDIFIHEGYRPRYVDALVTNFHLPRSTPLMLTAVFAGRKRLLSAYKTAISMGYRFFSYGDAMLVS